MSTLFLEILNMSISASYLIMAVVLLRLALKKAPKWISVLLFGIVAVRLICPITVESVLSLIPSAETVSPDIMTDMTPQINSGIPAINDALNPILNEKFSPQAGDSVNPMQILVLCASAVWLAGIAALLAYAFISYLKIKRRIATAVLVCGNIYKSENVSSPFVLGLIRPRVYLPFGLKASDEAYVIAHEQAHIRRRDYIWKPLGYLLLSIHWFNPLVWLGYILLCRDIEAACDEKVIKELGHGERADYSEALLSCSVSRRIISACPLAFGEQGVKSRVKSVLNYKKPAFWIIVIAIIASVAVTVLFLTNPITDDKDSGKTIIGEENIIHGWTGDFLVDKFNSTLYEYMGTKENLEWSSTDGAFIKTDYRIKSVSARILAPGAIEDYYTSTPDKYFIAPMVYDERYAFVDLGWFYRAEKNEQRSLTWSYFITVTDESDRNHHYYFRVNYKDPESIIYPHVLSTAVFDVDNDGRDEICEILYNEVDGEQKTFFSVKEIGSPEREYYIQSDTLDFGYSFVLTENGVKIISGNPLSSAVNPPSSLYDAYIDDGALVLDYKGEFPREDFFRIYSSAIFDIDGDGKDEICDITLGIESGVSSWLIFAREIGSAENEYRTPVSLDNISSIYFISTDGTVKVKAQDTFDDTPREYVIYDVSVKDGSICLTEKETVNR